MRDAEEPEPPAASRSPLPGLGEGLGVRANGRVPTPAYPSLPPVSVLHLGAVFDNPQRAVGALDRDGHVVARQHRAGGIDRAVAGDEL